MCLQKASEGLSQLRRENALLSRKSQQLQEELDRLHNAEDADIQPRRGKRATVTVNGLKAQIKALKGEVNKLKTVR